jgi:hypothetical protein
LVQFWTIFAGGSAFSYEMKRIVVPDFDVDLLSTQFLADGFYPGPAASHARAHGIDVFESREKTATFARVLRRERLP